MKAIILIYLLVIHTYIVITILKPNAISHLQIKYGQPQISNELTSYYYKMVSFHKRVDENIPDKSIIFIGDSITQGLAVIAISPGSVNFGIGQDTTVGVLNRLPYYASIKRSKLIIIEIGINDLSKRSNNEILHNYQKIIDLIPENIPVLFNAILPVDEIASHNIGANQRIRQINKGLENICNKNQKTYYFDIAEFMVDINGNLLENYHVGDGIHLSAQGKNIWISKLKTFSQKITQ